MLTIRLEVADLASVRFAYSPLQEAVFSLNAWTPGHPDGIYRDWLLESAGNLDPLDWPLLTSLRAEGGWRPDFVTPRPGGARPDVRTELDTIRATPAGRVRADLLASHGTDLPGPLAELAADPVRLADRLADVLGDYWSAVLQPRWAQMQALLEADITYRCHRIATGGAVALFEDLDETISWSDGLLRLDYDLLEHDVEVAGRGLPLVPSIFPRKPSAVIDPDLPPFLTYPARGWASLLARPDDTRTTLSALLGATRARLLEDLSEPASTTQLARRYGLTPSGINQHLGVLTNAGLLSRARFGHSVHYRRTPLGDALVRG
jgi:hypothetical protein